MPWNLVTKNLHGRALLHLHIALERHLKKDRFSVALSVRVPSNILRSKKSGPDIIKTFDQTVKALLRELETLKSKLGREALWKRRERPRQIITENKTATAQLEVEFELADGFLVDGLDGLVLQFKDSQPVFYGNYTNVRAIVNSASGYESEEPASQAKAA